MNALRALRIATRRMLVRNLDLMGLWFGLLVGQQFVPVTHYFGRGDLLPWMCLSLSLVALLRGRRLGAGPHPMLTARGSAFGRWCITGAMALSPWLVLAVHDLARSWHVRELGIAAGVAVGLVVLLSLGGEYGRTSWDPRPRRGWIIWFLGTILFAVVASIAGLGHRFFPGSEVIDALAGATTIGMGFLSMGLVSGRSQNHRQRAQAGRKDGRPYRRLLFPSLLAFVGPAGALLVMSLVLQGLDFDFAFIVALLVVVWGAIIWPSKEPMAVGCILHEVVPIGGKDKAKGETARPFHLPPQGALRFNPLRTRRTRVVHPWLVPVQSSRIADLDDPVQPLWSVPPRAKGHHVLGDASFEPDPLTKSTQWEELTIRIKAASENAKGGSGSQRIVVLRAFPSYRHGTARRARTYRWDPSVADESIQVVDQTTDTVNLRNGDVIVLASEGVAHAYEFEIGTAIYDPVDLGRARPPQLEDYVDV